MILSNENKIKLINKEKDFIEELKKYKNISGKVQLIINRTYTDDIHAYYENGYLWFEIPKYRITTLCNCLNDNLEYQNGGFFHNTYLGAQLDIIANRDNIIKTLENKKNEQDKLLDNILN